MEKTSVTGRDSVNGDTPPGQDFGPMRSDVVRSPRIRKVQITARL
ncbi:MAG TPA: MFS transporter, partial [Pantoea sp.]|nr:MFS transporter [Pantoea sp.]